MLSNKQLKKTKVFGTPTNGKGLTAYDIANSGGGITTTPGGATTQIQYNDAGVFAGTTALTWDGIQLTAEYIRGTLGVQIGTNSPLRWNAQAQMIGGGGDGIISIRNSAGTDFDRFQFGGGGSSFPALKRSGATLQTVLADDSGFAAVQSLYQRFGTGTPEGVVTAPIGATYHRTNGGANTSFYVKESGVSNTGWVAK